MKAIAARADVVKVSPIVPKMASDAGSEPLIRAVDAWQNAHTFGAGVRIGVIDTGLDYTHADFGGSGDPGDFTAAQATADDPDYDWYGNLTPLAQAKIGGGYDFAGDSYDPTPTDATYHPDPDPNPNPLGCDPHGTHVAGIIAGYGENADGTTFTGDYGALSSADLGDMELAPGVAPQATLYPFKVFGCHGGTDLVIPALDRALDPDNNGDTSDHLDIVNMSLGSDYSTPDDPENAVVDQLAKDGVLTVASIGNGGDATDIGGAPSSAVRALSVASSLDDYQVRDGLHVDAPSNAVPADTATGQNSQNYDYDTSGDVLDQTVVTVPGTGNTDGCDPYTPSQQAAVAGNTVWLEWDDNDATRRCGSTTRGQNAVAAGATGVILTSQLNDFVRGGTQLVITGVPEIPMFQLLKPGADALRSDAAAGTLHVSFEKDLADSVTITTPGDTDTLSAFSSRGPHGSTGVVKPDVAAPGDTVVSAGLGTGDGRLVDSGTSMAAPHAAGVAALVAGANPEWSPEQVKAAVMNTADHDLYTGPNSTGHVYGPLRDGAGRIDALGAVSTSVLAYDADDKGAVSASFGVIAAPVDGPAITRTRTIEVQNTGGTDATLAAEYVPAVTEPGVEYSLSQTSAILVPAGGSTDVTITVTVEPAALRHTIDPTMALHQVLPIFTRQYLSDASGRVIFTPDDPGAPQLRVPVYAAAKPVSTLTAAGGTNEITASGTGFDQGPATPDNTTWASLAVPMGLDRISGHLPPCAGTLSSNCTANQTAQGGDIHYVGSGSFSGLNKHHQPSLAAGYFYIGIATYGDSATIGNATQPYAELDVTGDGKPDFVSFISSFQDASAGTAATDILLNNVVDLHTGNVVDQEFVNWEDGSVDTNVFDTNTVIMPIFLGALGVSRHTKSFPITYSVGESSPYAVNENGDIDDVGPITVDAVRPKVDVHVRPGTVPLEDGNGPFPARVTKPNTRALVFFLHNGDGKRSQVVTVDPVATVLSAHAPKSIDYGRAATISGTLRQRGGDPIEHAAVELWAKPTGTTSFRPVATRTTTGAGEVTATVRPKQPTTYQWRFAGGSGNAAVRSPHRIVRVRQIVTMSARPKSVGKNGRFELFGTTRPAQRHAVITIQRQLNGGWHVVDKVKTRSQRLPTGRSTIGYTDGMHNTHRGRYKYRARCAGTRGRGSAVSAPVTIKVG